MANKNPQTEKHDSNPTHDMEAERQKLIDLLSAPMGSVLHTPDGTVSVAQAFVESLDAYTRYVVGEVIRGANKPMREVPINPPEPTLGDNF